MIYFGVTGLILIGIILIAEAIINGGFRTFEAETYGIICAAGLTDAVLINSLTIAFMNDRSGFVSLLTYMFIFYAFVADVVFFDERIIVLELTGAIIILLTTFTVSAIKLCQAYRKAKRTSQV